MEKTAYSAKKSSAGERTDKRSIFRFTAGRPSLWLVSTLWHRGSQPFDRLRTPADLSRWAVQAKLLDAPAEATETDLEAARALREAIYRTALARRAGSAPTPDDREIINHWATQPPPALQLSADGHTCARFASQPINAMLAAVARDAVELFASAEAGHIKVCAQPDCASLFLDTSRPRQRRWCNMNTCGNKAKKTTLRSAHTPTSRRQG